MVENPWLHIPAVDYEGHMEEIGQSAALRSIFQRVYAESRSRRVLILGCTTGKDFALLDPEVTTTAVGVDLNPAYLATARRELGHLGTALTLIEGDVLAVELPAARFDLIHAALLVEYVDPEALFRRMSAWLASTGVCSIVWQNAAEGVDSVTRTARESLLTLDGHMFLRDPERLNLAAAQAGLARESIISVGLPRGKSFSAATFTKSV
jgi:SAM-dependent methyltransferase